jgi:uncharacterized protein YkwD
MGYLRCLLWTAAALCTGPAAAQGANPLIGLINAYRNAPQDCEGRRSAAAGPLAPDRRLDGVKAGSGAQLPNALKARGYPAAKAYAMTLSGPVNAAAAMNLLRQRYCGPLLNPQYSNVGVSREGNHWQVVLARPLLSPALGDWRQAGQEVLRLTNAARRQPRICGTRRFDAAPPLRWAGELGAAALLHSRDMATRNYFDHRAPDGSHADARARRQGYDWRRVGENIAAGQGSPQQVVAAWLASPPHCENIMKPEFADLGAAYAVDEHSDSTIYWTQVFGTRR